MTADLTARIAQALSKFTWWEMPPEEAAEQLAPVFARLIAEETARLTAAPEQVKYACPDCGAELPPAGEWHSCQGRNAIIAAEARGRAAILAEIRTLPYPIQALTGKRSGSYYCTWCSASWAGSREHPPDDGCLWSRAHKNNPEPVCDPQHNQSPIRTARTELLAALVAWTKQTPPPIGPFGQVAVQDWARAQEGADSFGATLVEGEEQRVALVRQLNKLRQGKE